MSSEHEQSVMKTATTTSRRFKGGFLSAAGRGGPARLVGIVVCLALMVSAVVVLAKRREKTDSASQVAKMQKMNLLPGGTESTPAQEALRIKHANAEAAKAESQAKSYTPAMPGSQPLQIHEVGVDSPAASSNEPAPIKVVTAPPPQYTAPEQAPQSDVFDTLPKPPDETAKIQKVAMASDDADPGVTPGRQRAYEKMMGQWDIHPPRTVVVISEDDDKKAPSPSIQRTHDVSASANVGAPSQSKAHVLVPGGRGVYAHTILAVTTDSGGPIVLEADTGPLAGDRMIGSFQKSGTDRMVVRVSKLIHNGEEISVAGLVIAPDTMETAVASDIDEHYVERFALPAAAAFIQGVGQAAAMSNTTTSVSPYGGVTQSIGPMSLSQQAWVGAGAAAQAIGKELSQNTPKGPTIHLDANVGVGVMFLSDVMAK
ncbi:intracellular multiplication protein IcmE [Rhodoblastus acidophilus]|uniref:DotG/IcmE/VirB10 family protein n=1 Tax=Rhodoblastus acidophilus TaxID=1074 RepID=UPI002223FC27|nr:TrbI/VirB10 family protein [Rhodoblastus acidophilus]MCW2318906.1 intracellular multiplication protein IcmE [Rhodoblastus acidophilus]